MVAAEEREFERNPEALRVVGASCDLARVPSLRVKLKWNGDRWLLVANGPGPRSGGRSAQGNEMDVNGIISTGFCGALDPALRVGDMSYRAMFRAFEHPLRAARSFRRSCRRHGRGKEELRADEPGRAQWTWNQARCRKSRGVGRAVSLRSAPFPIPPRKTCLSISIYIATRTGVFPRSRIALAALGRPFTRGPGSATLGSQLPHRSRIIRGFLCRLPILARVKPGDHVPELSRP